MGGWHGDDLMWDGLACPPLEDYAFDFDTCTSTLDDDLLDNPLLDIEDDDGDMIANCFNEDEELNKMVDACLANPPTLPSHLLDDFPHLPAKFMVINKSDQITKANVATHPYGKGKVLKTLAQVLPLEKHSKTTFYCQTEQPKDRSRLDQTNHVVPVDNNKRKKADDYDDLRTEGLVSMKSVQGRRGAKVNDYNPNYHPPRRYGNHGKGKVLKMAIQALNLNEEQIKAFLGETEEVVKNRDKKRKIMDLSDTQPMRHKDITRLNNTNKLHDDYESRFEASRHMLHEAYKQAGDAKQKRHIQVIDFQKPETQQSGSKGKAKGKPSLRQKLMAMGTRKSSNKFPPYQMLSSCN